MIDLKEITKTYHTKTGSITALDNISLSVKSGEIMGIIGTSGAGKSTLIRCVNLLEKPSTGQVTVDQQALCDLSPAKLRASRRHIGMIFQHFNLLSLRTVFDNIAFPLELTGMSKDDIHQKVTSLLGLVGLENRGQHYPSELSGGQKQRVAIARALAGDPKVLLCDEATSALDPQTSLSILNLLEQIRDKLGITILLITHDMHVIKHICDRVAILEHGKIIEENTVAEFFTAAKTDVAKEFIASSIRQDLPKELGERLQSESTDKNAPVIRLWFHDESTSKPIIAGTCQRFHVDINILQANLEYIHHRPVGIMIIKIEGENQNIDSAIKHLKALGIKTEQLGYITHHVS